MTERTPRFPETIVEETGALLEEVKMAKVRFTRVYKGNFVRAGSNVPLNYDEGDEVNLEPDVVEFLEVDSPGVITMAKGSSKASGSATRRVTEAANRAAAEGVPVHTGGGMYVLPDGSRVRGKAAAFAAAGVEGG